MVPPPFIRLDEGRRLVLIDLTSITGARLVDELSALYASRPELSLWGFVYDGRNGEGRTSSDDVARLAEADRQAKTKLPEPYPAMRTAVVTYDRFFHLWAEVMCHQFPGRRIRGFRTPEAAESWVLAVAAEPELARAS
jgi:hypothetical protein